jgi:23S rRNA pseudouridine955/2504/2580 synthase/23S rRNA pseudouridine1911/1915/1917 synthase
VLLFATSLEAARSLSRQFRDREVQKTYLAIVAGTPPEDGGRIEVRVDEDRGRAGRMRVVPKKGKDAITDWRVLERYRGYALLKVEPRTGRTHQIRVSLLHVGYPLLVDSLYGGQSEFRLSTLKRRYKQKRDRPEIPLIARVSLHAAAIALSHPITGEPVEVRAPAPKDFELTLKNLRRYRELRRE